MIFGKPENGVTRMDAGVNKYIIPKYLVRLVKTPGSIERWPHVILVGIHRAFFGRVNLVSYFCLVS